MNIKELKYIADIEIMREGCLSKGIRLEVIKAAKDGHKFTIDVSTDDYIRIGSELRRSGRTGCMNITNSNTPNRKTVTFNKAK